MAGKRKSDDIKKTFVSLHLSKTPIRQISETLGVSVPTLYQWKYQLEKEGEILPPRSRKTGIRASKRDLRALRRAARQNPFGSAGELAKSAGISVNKQTARKYLRIAGL
jgi:transposase